MAKKRKNPFENEGFPPITEEMLEATKDTAHELGQLTPLMGGMTDEEGMMLFTVMGEMAEMGITPEMYSGFYNTYHKLRPLMEEPKSGRKEKVSSKKGKKSTDAQDDRTLLLKIQMKGVSKPPMWREVEVPADRTFLDLHDIIQCVVGLDDYHLWQFNRNAYHQDLVIGISDGDDGYGMGLHNVTNEAVETPISEYLGEEGAKLEYVYDFGDDWIFTVTVKKVLDKKIDYPVCTAFKGELNAIEDSGGTWGYEDMRANFADWKKLKKKEREAIAEESGYDSAEDYYEMLEDSIFDIEAVNDRLKGF